MTYKSKTLCVLISRFQQKKTIIHSHRQKHITIEIEMKKASTTQINKQQQKKILSFVFFIDVELFIIIMIIICCMPCLI